MREPRHKLNMLEPGVVLLKIMGALILGGAVARWLGVAVISIVLWAAAGLLLAMLILLLIIEQRQDKRMYLEAKKKTMISNSTLPATNQNENKGDRPW